MRVLALDTSTAVGSVAVVVDDRLVCELAVRVRESHGESLLPWVARALEAAAIAPDRLDLVVYGRGPGSFTGVRIGLAAAKGLALATGVPLVGISSLRALAHGLDATSDLVCPIVDARKHELYASALRFDADGHGAEAVPEHVGAPGSVGAHLRQAAGAERVLLVGEGARAYGDELVAAVGEPLRLAGAPHDFPRAHVMARLGLAELAAGRREDPASAAPVYLRPPDAEYKPRAL